MAKKQAVSSPLLPPPLAPYSHAIIANGFIFVSGQLGMDKEKPHGGTVAEQTEQVLKNLARVLNEAGSSMDKVLKTTVLLADINDFAAINEVYGKHFPDPKPARAAYAVAALPIGARVEIEAIALQ